MILQKLDKYPNIYTLKILQNTYNNGIKYFEWFYNINEIFTYNL